MLIGSLQNSLKFYLKSVRKILKNVHGKWRKKDKISMGRRSMKISNDWEEFENKKWPLMTLNVKNHKMSISPFALYE